MKINYGYKVLRTELHYSLAPEPELKTIDVIKFGIRKLIHALMIAALLAVGAVAAYKDPQSFAIGFVSGQIGASIVRVR